MKRIATGALLAAAVLAASTGCRQADHTTVSSPQQSAQAPVSAPPAAPSTPAAPPSATKPVTEAGPEALYADDKGKPDRPDLGTYRTKWAYLQKECTQQDADLAAIVIRVQAKQGQSSRWEAMDYMSALLSGPQSDCSVFDAG